MQSLVASRSVPHPTGNTNGSSSSFSGRRIGASRSRGQVPMAVFGGLKLPSFPSFGGGGAAATDAAKLELLEAIKPLKRGLAASADDKQEVERLARALERRNPTKRPLASELVNGQWELLYTTSESILGASRPAFLRPWGPIYQVIDAVGLTAANKEGAPLFNSVTAELVPQSAAKVTVQFKQFKLLGVVPVQAPPTAVGELEVTYLDDELRVSRGNKGNLFVLRMQNRNVKP